MSPFSPRLHEREANFPLNSAEIMTKKLILVAKEANWSDELLVAGTILKSLHAQWPAFLIINAPLL